MNKTKIKDCFMILLSFETIQKLKNKEKYETRIKKSQKRVYLLFVWFLWLESMGNDSQYKNKSKKLVKNTSGLIL